MTEFKYTINGLDFICLQTFDYRVIVKVVYKHLKLNFVEFKSNGRSLGDYNSFLNQVREAIEDVIKNDGYGCSYKEMVRYHSKRRFIGNDSTMTAMTAMTAQQLLLDLGVMVYD